MKKKPRWPVTHLDHLSTTQFNTGWSLELRPKTQRRPAPVLISSGRHQLHRKRQTVRALEGGGEAGWCEMNGCRANCNERRAFPVTSPQSLIGNFELYSFLKQKIYIMLGDDIGCGKADRVAWGKYAPNAIVGRGVA